MKDLIERLRDYSRADTDAMLDEAADALEQQTAEIERLKDMLRWHVDAQLEKSKRIATLEAALRKSVLMLKSLRPTTDNYEHRVAINQLLDESNKALGEE
jgi:hypothetical protein